MLALLLAIVFVGVYALVFGDRNTTGRGSLLSLPVELLMDLTLFIDGEFHPVIGFSLGVLIVWPVLGLLV